MGKSQSLLFIGKGSPIGLPGLNKLSWSVSGASLKSPRNQVEDSEGLAWTVNYGLEADSASLEILLSPGPLTTPGNVWVVSHFKVKKPGMMPNGHRAWNTNKRKWSMLAPGPQQENTRRPTSNGAVLNVCGIRVNIMLALNFQRFCSLNVETMSELIISLGDLRLNTTTGKCRSCHRIFSNIERTQ